MNYFVFVNGRLLNSAFYKVLIPNLEDNRIENKVLYLSKPISSDDTLDVFYIGNNAFTRINGTGDLVVKPFRVKATEPIQRLFKIPKPYNMVLELILINTISFLYTIKKLTLMIII